MSFPAFTLEIEFTPGIWTNVSLYLRSGTTKRGKAKAIERVSPGRMTLVLSNQGRQFDPEYSTNLSPGNIMPGKAVRLKVTHNAVTYPVFTGFIERITQQYNPPKDATVRIDCVDGLAKLAAANLGSPWELTLANHTPRLWLRLGEENEGVYAYDRSGNNFHAVYSSTSAIGADSLIVLDDDSAVSFDDPAQYIQLGHPADLPSVPPWTITFLMDIPVVPASNVEILRPNVAGNGIEIYMDTAGKLNVTIKAAGITTTHVKSQSVLTTPADPQLISIVAAPGVPLRIFQFSNDNSDTATDIGVGGTIPVASHVLGFTAEPLVLDEFLAFPYALTTLELVELGLAQQAWSVDTGDNRIHRILDAAGWPLADRDITTQWDEFIKGTALKTSVLAHMENLTATQVGRLFITKDGVLTLLSRLAHNNVPYLIAQGILGDGSGEIGYSEMGDYSLDLETVENIVRRRWTSRYTNADITIEANDFASQGKYGPRAKSPIESEYVAIDSEFDLAEYRLRRLSEPVPYVESLKIVPQTDAQWIQVLERELAERIKWKRRPQGMGDPISKPVIIEGIAHFFSAKKWQTTFLIDATDAPLTLVWRAGSWGENWA